MDVNRYHDGEETQEKQRSFDGAVLERMDSIDTKLKRLERSCLEAQTRLGGVIDESAAVIEASSTKVPSNDTPSRRVSIGALLKIKAANEEHNKALNKLKEMQDELNERLSNTEQQVQNWMIEMETHLQNRLDHECSNQDESGKALCSEWIRKVSDDVVEGVEEQSEDSEESLDAPSHVTSEHDMQNLEDVPDHRTTSEIVTDSRRNDDSDDRLDPHTNVTSPGRRLDAYSLRENNDRAEGAAIEPIVYLKCRKTRISLSRTMVLKWNRIFHRQRPFH